MMGKQALAVAAALALGTAPAFAQGNPQAQAGQTERMDMADMICTMGMLPHGGMSGSMMGGQGMMGGMMGGRMQQGAAAGGMQHNMPGMQPGAMGGARPDSAAKPGAAGGMQHGMMGGMQPGAAGQGMGAMEMMMAHPVTPTMLIHHAKDLGLTADQQAKVAELAKTSQASCQAHLKEAQASHQAAAAQLDKAAPDLDDYEKGMKEAAEHLIEGHVAVVKAGVEAEALLTPAQREKLKATTAAMHGGK